MDKKGDDKTKLVKIALQLGPVEVVYDCGSRDAIDGLELAIATGAKELHIFECNPPSFEVCKSNVAKYKPDTLTVFLNDYAIDEHPGVVSFYPVDPKKTVTPHAGGNVGASSLLLANPDYPNEKYVQNKIEVRSTKLDEYCKTHRPPDILWLDLQGVELRALRGAKNILNHVKIIHLEVGFRPMYNGQALFWDLQEHLQDRFKLAHLDMGRWPRLLTLYRLLGTGPWVTNAIYTKR